MEEVDAFMTAHVDEAVVGYGAEPIGEGEYVVFPIVDKTMLEAARVKSIAEEAKQVPDGRS